jgi:hypothetical protein
MRRRARFQPDHIAWQRLNERQQLATPQLLAQNHSTTRIDAVNLKNMLRQIQPIVVTLPMDGSLGWCLSPIAILAPRCHSGPATPTFEADRPFATDKCQCFLDQLSDNVFSREGRAVDR